MRNNIAVFGSQFFSPNLRQDSSHKSCSRDQPFRFYQILHRLIFRITGQNNSTLTNCRSYSKRIRLRKRMGGFDVRCIQYQITADFQQL